MPIANMQHLLKNELGTLISLTLHQYENVLVFYMLRILHTSRREC